MIFFGILANGHFLECGRFAAARLGPCAWRNHRGRPRCVVAREGVGAVAILRLRPARHPALRYGIALNDAGYFWEAQEVLEAVWAAAPQGGRERILLRACIQVANANLKLRTQKPRAAARHFGEALAEVEPLLARTATGRGGFADSFPLPALAAHLKAKLAQPSLSKADWIALGAKI